jgi:hypothetical protein
MKSKRIREKLAKRVADGSTKQEWVDFLCAMADGDVLSHYQEVPPLDSEEFKSKTTKEWVAHFRANHKTDSQVRKEKYEASKSSRKKY